MAFKSTDRALGLLIAFIGGLIVGVIATRIVVAAPDHAYRTKVALPLKDPRGRLIGELPANTLLLSSLPASKSEHGWSALVPLLVGDGVDAVAVLRETEVQRPISSTEMLFVQHRYGTRSPAVNVQGQNSTRR